MTPLQFLHTYGGFLMGTQPQKAQTQTLKSLPVPLSNHAIFRTTADKPHVKSPLESLPNELLLEIFSHLELKPYIISHGVCKKWRQLLPSTKLHPIRERLLSLYHSILSTPGFEKTQEWTNQNLQPFDREQYILCLLQQYPIIPEEFRIWILEWPARLVIQSTWPGLPFLECHAFTPIVRRFGVNWIAYRSFSPKLSSLVYRYGYPSQTLVPGLLIWRHATTTDWLIFGHDEPDLFGRVFCTFAEYHSPGGIPYYPRRTTIDDCENDDSEERSDTESVISDGEECPSIFDDWIHYLEFLWGQTSKELHCPRKTFPDRDLPIPQPVVCKPNSPAMNWLPAHAWDSCQRGTIV